VPLATILMQDMLNVEVISDVGPWKMTAKPGIQSLGILSKLGRDLAGGSVANLGRASI
jgi:hypothetical protein